MKKSTKNLVIGLGIAAVFFAIISLFFDADWLEALSGVVIGSSLIGTAYFQKDQDQAEAHSNDG